jgi:uncharacterized protein (DUF885 family)
MPTDPRITALGDRYVAELFAYDPASARVAGDSSHDGRVGPIGAGATARRVLELDRMSDELQAIEQARSAPGDREERADVITLRHRLAFERFELVDLEATTRNPLSTLFRGADPQPYCTHSYAPEPDRAEGLTRQLEQLPDWLDAALEQLGHSLDEGPRSVSIEVARGLASFFRDDLDSVLPLTAHAAVRTRLHAAAGAAAAGCERFAAEIEARGGEPSPPLGERRFLAMLEAQEGVTETLASLRAMAEVELTSLRAQFEELAGQVAPGGGIDGAVRRMESDHPSAESLIDDAAASLDRLRDFWRERNVVSIPDAPCRVLPSPPFLRFISAAFDAAGPLAAADVESNYIVTPVHDGMSDEEADEWLRALNHWSLENIGVHEVYPGHFVHGLLARDQPSLVRRIGWTPGFGEGWAHYTELLAVEQGLANGRPMLRLAQVQDALLRACRFRSALALHTEGATVADATRLFMDSCGMSEYPARREAERGSYDPMYLSYTYGKLQILAWRAELEREPGFSLLRFHDTMLASGLPPLAAVRELVMSPE